MMDIQGKEKASGSVPEAENESTLGKKIVPPTVFDSIEQASSADVDPCGFSVVVERIRDMSPEDFKSKSKTMAKEFANGSGIDGGLMLKVVKGVRCILKGEEREKAPWETDPTPWPEEVDLLDTIREIENIIRRVMVCEERYVTAAAYYIAATWFVDSVQYAPYAVITAPAKRCGKSVLLDLMSRLVKRPYMLSGKPSDAAIFRTLDKYRPTLLLDEVDTYLSNADELQGILNGGISRRTAMTARCEKYADGDIEPRIFRTFGFKVMSGIGADRSGTALVDRAIVLRLSRKTRNDKRDKLRHIPSDQWESICRKLMRLSLQYSEAVEKLSSAPISTPESLGDRACDTWESLFILADLCGEDEGRRVRNVACEIAGEGSEDSWQVDLLSDAADIARQALQSGGAVTFDFGSLGNVRVAITDGGIHGDCIQTTSLHLALTNNPDRQWREFGRSGKPIAQHLMTKTIKGYGVNTAKLKKAGGCMCFEINGENGLLMADERYGVKKGKDD